MVFKQSKAKQAQNANMSQEDQWKTKLYNLYKQRALELEKAASLLQTVDGKKEQVSQFLMAAAECTERAADLLDEQCAACLERINELAADRIDNLIVGSIGK